MRRSLMCWKANSESFLLVLVLALERSWIILCDHDNVLHHQFLAKLAFVSCRALSPCSHFYYKLSSHRYTRF
jgi:hypothetical protein